MKDTNEFSKDFNYKPKVTFDYEKGSLAEYCSYLKGRDERRQNMSNSTTTFTILEFMGDDFSNPEQLADSRLFVEKVSRYTQQPEVDVAILRNGYVRLNLKFLSEHNPDLHLLFDELEKFAKLSTESTLSEDRPIPLGVFNIMAVDFMDESYLSLQNPVFWGIMPGDSFTNPLNTLSILFELDNVNIIRLNNYLSEDEINSIITDEVANESRNKRESEYTNLKG